MTNYAKNPDWKLELHGTASKTCTRSKVNLCEETTK